MLQQWWLPHEPYLYFPTATVMTAPALACIYIPLPPLQSTLPQKPHSLSDVAAEHASAEATFTFRCHSRARFRRSHNFFQMLQHSPLPQKPHCLSDATAEPASAEATFSFRCRRRARFHRSHILFQMPQQSPLPQKLYSLSDATAVPVSAEATFSFRCPSRARFRRSHIFFQMPQQCPLPQKPHSLFRCRSSAHFCRNLILFSVAAAVLTSADATYFFRMPHKCLLQQKPLFSFQMLQQCRYNKPCTVSRQPSAMNILGGELAPLWLLSCD